MKKLIFLPLFLMLFNCKNADYKAKQLYNAVKQDYLPTDRWNGAKTKEDSAAALEVYETLYYKIADDNAVCSSCNWIGSIKLWYKEKSCPNCHSDILKQKNYESLTQEEQSIMPEEDFNQAQNLNRLGGLSY
jgi:hypothetical protein